MSLLKDMAVVLRRLDYSETSQVLAVFTREHGQERLIAKGIKRGTKTRVAVGVDLLELGHVVYSSNPNKAEVLGVMTEWRQIDSYPHLRADLSRLYAAQYAAEVTSQLTEPHDPHVALFDGLVELLQLLSGDDVLRMLIQYLRKLLLEIGMKPEGTVCMNCGRGVTGDPIIYFSSRQGGAICRDCEPAVVEKRRVTAEELAILDGATGGPSSLARVFDLLDYHLREIMCKPAKLSAPFKLAIGMAK
ncbi:MAG: DNA repair protein RecO [Planctomycetes bacterium]|nr:DNA repair protein RecO [Planctomycetota bacterium]